MTSRRTVRRPGGSYAAGRPFEGLPSVPLPQPLLAAPPERRGGAWRVSPSRWCAAARYPPPTRIFSRARARAPTPAPRAAPQAPEGEKGHFGNASGNGGDDVRRAPSPQQPRRAFHVPLHVSLPSRRRRRRGGRGQRLLPVHKGRVPYALLQHAWASRSAVAYRAGGGEICAREARSAFGETPACAHSARVRMCVGTRARAHACYVYGRIRCSKRPRHVTEAQLHEKESRPTGQLRATRRAGAGESLLR